MIIGIAGPTASGKTTTAHMLASELDAFRIKYSDILSQMAFERGLDAEDKSTLQNLFLSERKTRGEDFLAREMEERLLKTTHKHVIIEGNRRLADIEMLRRLAQKKDERLFFLYIDATVNTRFERYNSRQQKHEQNPITFEAFMKLERNDAEDELEKIRDIFRKEGMVIDSDTKSPEEIFAEVKAHLPLP